MLGKCFIAELHPQSLMYTFFEVQIVFTLSFNLSDDLLEDSDSEEHSRSDSVTGM
jgi:hypothetical protein